MVSEIEKRWLKENYIIGFRLKKEGRKVIAYSIVRDVEFADYPYEGQTVPANGIVDPYVFVDSSERKLLDPDRENLVFHYFLGISPSRLELYRQFPQDVDRNSLKGVRTIGSGQGAITGFKSPYRNPSVRTEEFTIMQLYPAYGFYNPLSYSVVPKIYIYANKYSVDWVEHTVLSKEEKKKARYFTLGGLTRVEAPGWLIRKDILVPDEEVE